MCFCESSLFAHALGPVSDGPLDESVGESDLLHFLFDLLPHPRDAKEESGSNFFECFDEGALQSIRTCEVDMRASEERGDDIDCLSGDVTER